MSSVGGVLGAVRGLGRGRLSFLGYVAGGHIAIHWFQTIFAVVLPSIKLSLGLSDIQVGYLQSARQLTGGTMNLPVGFLADSFATRRAVILASALVLRRVRRPPTPGAVRDTGGAAARLVLGFASRG